MALEAPTAAAGERVVVDTLAGMHVGDRRTVELTEHGRPWAVLSLWRLPVGISVLPLTGDGTPGDQSRVEQRAVGHIGKVWVAIERAGRMF